RLLQRVDDLVELLAERSRRVEHGRPAPAETTAAGRVAGTRNAEHSSSGLGRWWEVGRGAGLGARRGRVGRHALGFHVAWGATRFTSFRSGYSCARSY